MIANGAIGVISAMVAPALFIVAAASLAASALTRMARVVDRARALAAVVHEGRLDRIGATPELARRWLMIQRSRARRTALAVTALYAAVVLFVGACLFLGLQTLGFGLPEWAPLAFVLPGTVLLLGAAVWMSSETLASHVGVIEEIDNALARLAKEDSR